MRLTPVQKAERRDFVLNRHPSDLSPLTHLAGPWRDPDGRWHRAKNKVDDMYMACVFAEAAFYLKLVTPMPDYTISSAGSRPIRKILNEL